MRFPLLSLTLAAALSAPAGAQGGQVLSATPAEAQAARADVADAVFEALNAEFRAADQDWSSRLKAADKATKKELRKNRPERRFYGRFREAGLAGSGRSLLWAVRNVKKSGLQRGEQAEHLTAMAGQLLRKHVDEPWFLESGALEFVVRQGRTVGDATIEEWFLEVGRKAKSETTRVVALSTLSGRLSRSKDEAARARGAALMDRIEKEFPMETLQRAFTGARFAQMFLNVGQLAPDFSARTVDGVAFQLADYRGKVTLIDFWGFW